MARDLSRAGKRLEHRKADIKKFRRGMSALKKAGLLGKDVEPSKTFPTPYRRKLLRKFAAVVSGRQTTIKLPKGKKETLQELGFDVRNGRVVVDKFPDQKIIRKKSDLKGFEVHYKDNTSRRDIPLKTRTKNFDEFFDNLEKQLKAAKYDPTKERISVRFHGHALANGKTFRTVADLKRYVYSGSGPGNADEYYDPEAGYEVDNIHIYRVRK